MGVAIKFRKGTATEHASFEGQAAEVTVQTNTTGLPWSLRVHDGENASGYWVPTVDDVATLTNKTLTNVVLSGTVKDASGNVLGTISGGKLILGAGLIMVGEEDLELMVSRLSRKNQMILGD